MDLSQLLFGVFSGDMEAMSVLFAILLPIWLVGYGVFAGIKKILGK